MDPGGLTGRRVGPPGRRLRARASADPAVLRGPVEGVAYSTWVANSFIFFFSPFSI